MNKLKIFFANHKKTTKFFKVFLSILGFVVCLVIITFGALQLNCSPSKRIVISSRYQSTIPMEHQRPEVSTYLTYPEWFIVYSSDEYARFLENKPPSGFPYFGSIKQYWGNYCQAYATTKARGEFSFGDHLMLFVIGWSYSAELGIKGIYENTVGRITEFSGSYPATQEDVYADKVAKDYVEFIRIRPWYEYNFAHAFGRLWQDNSFFGRHFVRKIERRLFLSTEYGIKTVYGWLIGLGSHSVYGVEDIQTYAIVKNSSDSIFSEFDSVKKIKEFDNGLVLVSIPRYQPFSEIAPKFASKNIEFTDIAGNKEIFITALVPRYLPFNPSLGNLVFETNILTDSSKKRIGISLPVESLSKSLISIEANGGSIEHVYDY